MDLFVGLALLGSTRPEAQGLGGFHIFFFSFFASSWLPLGLHFGAVLAPKLAQVRLKLPLDTLLFRKHDFSKKRAPP